VPRPEIGGRIDGQLAVGADAHTTTTDGASQDRHRVGSGRRPKTTALDGLSPRSPADTVRSLQLVHALGRPRSRIFLAGADERRRLARDLHDGVQNELVALIIKLTLAEQDPDTPPSLARKLSALGTSAQSVLESVRQIARGIYPQLLADFGVVEALRARAMRASIDVSVAGTAPRSTEQAEAAIYFSPLEAIQNAAKHAGRKARVTLRLRHDDGTLAARIADDGQGFDPAQTSNGAGLRNISDRIETLGGMVLLSSRPGRGTILTISLPWPPRPTEDRSDGPGSSGVATSVTLAETAARSSSPGRPAHDNQPRLPGALRHRQRQWAK
jgi:signal transduction histidine kinase